VTFELVNENADVTLSTLDDSLGADALVELPEPEESLRVDRLLAPEALGVHGPRPNTWRFRNREITRTERCFLG
jgi:hypothetical protein